VLLKLVKGVLPPLTVEAGVAVPLADFFAAFSASRFCFDADGAILYKVYEVLTSVKGRFESLDVNALL